MPIFVFSGHTLDLGKGRLWNSHGDVMLRPKSLTLLTYLVRNPGRVISKDELIEAVWPDVMVSDESLSQCLKDVRAALGPEAEGLIRTVPRRGIILDEARLSQPEEGAPQELPKTVTVPSLAVLPFETTAGDHVWLSDGIAEDITTALARNGRLKVLSKNYSFAAGRARSGGGEIARALGVSHLLEGSARLIDDHIRISVRLVVGATGELLWAERFDRRLTDIFAIQDEVTEAVVTHLELELLPEERRAISRARTTSIEAYNYELRARQLALILTRSYLLPARRMYARAAALDPQYARAYAGMAICDCYLRDWHGEAISLPDTLALAERALELDPALVEAHAARGFALFCSERYSEAEHAYRNALSIDPNSYEANFFYAMTMARFTADRDQAIAMFTLTAELRPEDFISPMMAASYYPRGDARKLKWAHVAVGRAGQAAERHPENASPLHRGAVALAHLGRKEEAYAWLERAMVIDPTDFIAHVNAACTYAVLGDPDLALDHLEQAAANVSQNTIDMLRRDPDFEAIQNHPRYEKILRHRAP
jgi:adenylate cyclase